MLIFSLYMVLLLVLLGYLVDGRLQRRFSALCNPEPQKQRFSFYWGRRAILNEYREFLEKHPSFKLPFN